MINCFAPSTSDSSGWFGKLERPGSCRYGRLAGPANDPTDEEVIDHGKGNDGSYKRGILVQKSDQHSVQYSRTDHGKRKSRVGSGQGCQVFGGCVDGGESVDKEGVEQMLRNDLQQVRQDEANCVLADQKRLWQQFRLLVQYTSDGLFQKIKTKVPQVATDAVSADFW